ncbi:MAG: hypothetical protein KA028_01995 [Candidatus Pacebacteria bacterium]|nr:hypothetical protein [Candidatus Paceibacterota bacterium]MBP9851673.1 hypothetical protein [Candidatus Paceibacterota bacterium]
MHTKDKTEKLLKELRNISSQAQIEREKKIKHIEAEEKRIEDGYKADAMKIYVEYIVEEKIKAAAKKAVSFYPVYWLDSQHDLQRQSKRRTKTDLGNVGYYLYELLIENLFNVEVIKLNEDNMYDKKISKDELLFDTAVVKNPGQYLCIVWK